MDPPTIRTTSASEALADQFDEGLFVFCSHDGECPVCDLPLTAHKPHEYLACAEDFAEALGMLARRPRPVRSLPPPLPLAA